VILFWVAVGTMSVIAQEADGEIAVSPSEISIEQQESETIRVTYERLSNATPQGVQYTLTYNPDVIAVVDQKQGSYLGGNDFLNDISTPGEIRYAEVILDQEGVEKSSGTVATITIEPANELENAATTELEFTTAKASEAETEFVITATNGTVEAAGSSETDDNTDDDSSDDETSTDDDSSDDENNTDDEEPEDTDSNTAERTNSSTAANSNVSTTLNNETEDRNAEEPINGEQPANDSSSATDSEGETDTDESVPGFGISVAVLSILIINYIVSKKP
jgi:hypothetical protein